MKTKEEELNEVSLILIHKSIADTKNDLHKVQNQMDNILLYGYDQETGTLTRDSERDYDRLHKKELELTGKLKELELQQAILKPSAHLESKERDDYDEWKVADQYREELEAEKALKEIQQAREQNDQNREQQNDIER